MKKQKIEIPWTKIIVEFVSIVVAVFMALLVDEWKDNHNNKQLARNAMENITLEIQKNYDSVLVYHQTYNLRIKEIDSLLYLIRMKSPNVSLKGYQFVILYGTAWDAAKLTQAFNYMEFEEVGKLSDIYNLQNIYNTTVQNIMNDLLFTEDADSYDEAEKVLQRHKRVFSGINGFEDQLLDSYRKFLKSKGKLIESGE